MKKENRKSYPSDLTDRQWKEIEALYTGMRKCKWSKRELTNAVLYLVDTGCKWRQLPHDFPPYSTVHIICIFVLNPPLVFSDRLFVHFFLKFRANPDAL